MRKVDPVRRHAVRALHGAQRDDVVVGAAVAHDADGADRQEDRERLPRLVVEPGELDLVDHDRVRLAQDVERLARHRAEVAHAQPRPRERLAHDDRLGKAELAAHFADFVLEEARERLQQLELEVLRKSAHVVVALDHVGGIAVDRDALDDVGVRGALREPLDVRDGAGGVGEDLDELVPDRLALRLRLLDAGELVEEAVGRVHEAEVHLEIVAEELLHARGLVLAQQAVVDEDAGELRAEGLVQQRGGDRGVHPAGEAEDDVLATDLRLDVRDGLRDERGHGPGAGAAADAAAEIAEDRGALLGVHDLGMELDAVEAARRDGDRGMLRVVRLGHALRAGRQRRDLVAVAHPHLQRRLHAREERTLRSHAQLCAPVLPRTAAHDLAPQRLHGDLHAVADPEDRDAEIEDRGVDRRGALLVDAGGAAGEDDAARFFRQDLRGGDVEGNDLAVDVALANAPRDELAILGAEVEDEDGFGHGSAWD